MLDKNQLTKTAIHISPRRLCHVNMYVSNTETTLKFYNKVAGFNIVLRQPKIGGGFLSNGNTHHDVGMIEITTDELYGDGDHKILKKGQGSTPGLYHFGWEMESEWHLVNALKRIRKSEYPVYRVVEHRSSRSVYLKDSDGNIHEFYADVRKDWRDAYREAAKSGAVSSGWNLVQSPRDVSGAKNYWVNPALSYVSDACFQTNRFSHGVMRVQNFELMELFFINVVGLYPNASKNELGIRTFEAAEGSYRFSIGIVDQDRYSAVADSSRINHIGFELSKECSFESAKDNLVAAGVPIEYEVDNDYKQSIFIKDPDGTLCEFTRLKIAHDRGDEIHVADDLHKL